VADDGTPLTCPSGQPGEDAHIFGVVAGTAEAPRVAYLKRGVEIGPAEMAALGEIEPTRVFRYAAPCANGACAQYAGGRCSLARRLAEQLAPVVDSLPSCQIRATCRWYHEIGAPACMRCPQVTTLVAPVQTELGRAAALPEGAGSA
jgi:hypothetical protein